MKKTLTVLLLSVVAGLFFSCSNSSDTSTLMTVAVIQQQQAAEAAAVKSASVSVGDVYQVPMTNGSDTYHYYYKVTSSTNVELYIYKNDSTTPESGSPMNVAYNTNTSGSFKFIQNEGNTYWGTFIAKGNDNTSFCTTWSYTVSGTTISYQFSTDKTGVCCFTGNPNTPFTYTVSPYNSNLYTLSYNGIEMKVYYDASSGITMFGDSTKLTKVSGLPA